MEEELIEVLPDEQEQEVEVEEEAEAAPDPAPVKANIGETYSRTVQTRMDRLTFERREADRRSEQAERRSTEAVRLAQVAVQRHQQAAAQLNALQEDYKREAIGNRTAQAVALQHKFTAARESADTAAEADAIAQIGAVAAERRNLETWSPPQHQGMEMPQFQPAEPSQPAIEIDAVSQDWIDRNDWLRTNPKARDFAIAHEIALSQAGYTASSKECYDQLDAAMRQYFPDLVGSQPASQRSASSSPRVASAVVGGNRISNSASPNGAKTMKLTSSQAKLASDLGLSYKDYWSEYIKENPQ